MLPVALALVMGQEPPNLTFRSNFETIGTVVEKLSGQSRVPMAAHGEIAMYPIYLNVSGMPLTEIRDRIAKATGGEWVQSKDAFYLKLDQTRRTLLERAGDPDLIAAIEASLNIAPKEPPKLDSLETIFSGGGGDPAAAMQGMSDFMAAMRNPDQATLNLTKAIGAKSLSSIADGRRVVLSTDPTPMQGQIPAKSVPVIKSLLAKAVAEAEKESARRQAELKIRSTKPNAADAPPKNAKEGDPEPDPKIEEPAGMFSMGLTGIINPEIAKNPATIIASFQITGRSALNVEISAYGKDGSMGYVRSVTIPIVSPEASRQPVKGETPIEVKSSSRMYAKTLVDARQVDPLTSLLMSAIANPAGAFEAMFKSTGPNGARVLAPPPEDLANQMASPKAHEPLALLLGPVLDKEAAKGRNVIAVPSDDVFTLLAESLAVEKPTVEGVLDDLDRSLTQEVETDGTWTTVRASSYLELKSAHCNRAALDQLIQAGRAKGYVNLEDTSKFAAMQGTARGSELVAFPLLSSVLRTSDLSSAVALTGAGFDALKFYASLSREQKNTLAAKRPVAVASLNPNQLSLLGQMMFNGALPPFRTGGGNFVEDAFDELTNDPKGEEADEMFGGMIALSMMGLMSGGLSGNGRILGMGGGSIQDERTVFLPQGVPVVGEITMSSMSGTAMYATDSATNMSTITMPEMFAIGRAAKDVPIFGRIKTDYDTFYLGKQTEFFLKFKFKDAGYFFGLHDVSVDKSRKFLRSELPQKVRDKMDGKGMFGPGEGRDDGGESGMNQAR